MYCVTHLTSVAVMPTLSPALKARSRFSFCESASEGAFLNQIRRTRYRHACLSEYLLVTHVCFVLTINIMSYLVCGAEGIVRNVTGQICVINGAERQAILPAAAEVCDLNILQWKKQASSRHDVVGKQAASHGVLISLFSDLVTLGTTLTPAQQGVPSGAAMTPQQSAETVLRSERARKYLLIIKIKQQRKADSNVMFQIRSSNVKTAVLCELIKEALVEICIVVQV